MAGGGHGGGAWKVAYADFVTAMMALFMVLWISAQDKKILIATSRYFQAPFNSPLNAASGVLQLDSNNPANRDSGNKPDAMSKSSTAPDKSVIDLQFLNSVAKDFYRLLNLDQNVADRPIDIQVTSDGLRVTLFDRSSQPLFKENTTEFTAWGDFVMQSLAWMIDRYGFRVVIEGHTRHGLVLPQPSYTSWELSADRANASRRALTHYAVESSLIERVTGYADTRPMPASASDAESNQRVTLSLTPGPRSKPGLVHSDSNSAAAP